MMLEKISEYIYQFFYYCVFLLLSMYISICFTSYAYLATGIGIQSHTLPVSFVCWIIFVLFSSKHVSQINRPVQVICMAISVGWFIWSNEYVSWMYDTSFDGQWYHFDAVYNLVKGWNPFYHYLLPEQTSRSELYLNHFPKISWISAASVYAFTGKMETIKVFSYYFLPVLVFLPAYTIRSIFKLPFWVSLPFGFIIAFNPIVMLSLYSSMNDGVIYALFISSVAFALLYLKEKQTFQLWFAIILFSILANYKYTTTIYACVLIGVFYLWQLFAQKKTMAQLLPSSLVFIILTFFFWGYPSFITNIIHQGNPVYPMMEKSQLAGFFVKEKIYPADFLDMNVAERLWASIISLPSWRNNPLSSEPRTLFKVPAYLEGYYAGTSDLAAMGPFFAESLLFCLFCLVASLFFIPRGSLFKLLAFVITILATVIINPECWILRYVPQLWLVPVTFLLACATITYLRPAVMVGLLFMFFNTYIATDIYVTESVHKNRKIKTEMMLVKEAARNVKIYPGWVLSFKQRMIEYGIDTNTLDYIYIRDSNSVPFTTTLSATYTLLGNKK